jgi:hypothetical protein
MATITLTICVLGQLVNVWVPYDTKQKLTHRYSTYADTLAKVDTWMRHVDQPAEVAIGLF